MKACVATGILCHDSTMKLQRSTRDCLLAGVCGGMAESLGWSPFRVRLIFVLVSILSAAFPGILVYLILWFLMPRRTEIEV
jgi:phage shock protein C